MSIVPNSTLMVRSSTSTPDHITAYNRAKVALMMNKQATFFTSVYFSLKHVWDETHPTAYTNGTVVAFNPKFFLSLSQEERVFLMLHEALHVAFVHMDRLGTRQPYLWNKAADHAINLLLLKQGLTMPHGGLADPRFENMSADAIYKTLEAEQTHNPDAGGQLSMEDLRDSGMSSPQLQEQVQDILVRASIRAKQEGVGPGNIPKDIQVVLDRLLKPKLPWQQILQRFLHAHTKSDYTFLKPNRRFLPDYWMPSLYSESLRDIVVAVDTSGSVSDAGFSRILAEVTQIMRMMKPPKITLVPFDTQVKQVTQVRNLGELSKVNFTGRGGTRINPVMRWAVEHKPAVLLVFSDGEFRAATVTPPKGTSVLWLVYDNPTFTAPFGKVIHFEMSPK